MRYSSNQDRTLLVRQSLGPAASIARRRYALPVPGRGIQSGAARTALRGFGATSLGPPVGAGTGAGAEIGASQGASIGSAIMPGIGTAIGAVVGAIGGAIAGSISKKDPEQYNFDQAVAIWQQQPDAVYSIGNKYLPLAGLFDLNIHTNIPIYKKFGHMGELAFVNALVGQLYAAVQAGKVKPTDTAITVFNNIIQPWINGFGYGAMQDPHADLIDRLIIGMIADWFTGDWKNDWYARGGDFPFGNLPSFPGFPQSTAGPTPSPMAPTSTQQQSGVLQAVTNAVTQAVNPAMTPQQFLTLDGATINHGDTTGLKSASGTAFWFQDNVVFVNGRANGNGALMELVNGQVYLKDMQGHWYQWNLVTSSWAQIPSAPVSGPSTGGSPATVPTAGHSSIPTVGASLTQAPDSVTGQLTSLPPGAAFGGLTNSGAWVINYAGGTNPGSYTLVNGVLTPYGSATPAATPPVSAGTGAVAPPAGYQPTGNRVTLSGQTYPLYSDAVGNTYLWNGTQMVPYQSAVTSNTPSQPSGGGGGGGGGGYSPGFNPDYSTQPVGVSSSAPVLGPVDGVTLNPMLLIGGAVILLLLAGR